MNFVLGNVLLAFLPILLYAAPPKLAFDRARARGASGAVAYRRAFTAVLFSWLGLALLWWRAPKERTPVGGPLWSRSRVARALSRRWWCHWAVGGCAALAFAALLRDRPDVWTSLAGGVGMGTWLGAVVWTIGACVRAEDEDAEHFANGQG